MYTIILYFGRAAIWNHNHQFYTPSVWLLKVLYFPPEPVEGMFYESHAAKRPRSKWFISSKRLLLPSTPPSSTLQPNLFEFLRCELSGFVYPGALKPADRRRASADQLCVVKNEALSVNSETYWHLSGCSCLLQKWRPKGVALQHTVSGLCLDSHTPAGPPVIAQCRPQVPGQSWEPQIINWFNSWVEDELLEKDPRNHVCTLGLQKNIFGLPLRTFCELLSCKPCCEKKTRGIGEQEPARSFCVQTLISADCVSSSTLSEIETEKNK